MSIVRWRHPPHALLLFFFSESAGVGPADELTLLFAFTVVGVAISALRFALLFVGGGEGSSSPSISSSSEFPPVASSSPEDLSDKLESVEESVDSGVFRVDLAPYNPFNTP